SQSPAPVGFIKVPLIAILPFSVFQKLGRLVLWEDLITSSLQFTETQELKYTLYACSVQQSNIAYFDIYKYYKRTTKKSYQTFAEPPSGIAPSFLL
ncbi:hypothetical protein, partial [Frisingicoccus sp.]|uniref:hypothetical protein n=1 Tax=Frisingicoccus sp. TaxID=1918627 RepID=UPI00386428D5